MPLPAPVTIATRSVRVIVVMLLPCARLPLTPHAGDHAAVCIINANAALAPEAVSSAGGHPDAERRKVFPESVRGVLRLELCPGDAALSDNRQEGADLQLRVIGHGNCHGAVRGSVPHGDMTSTPSNFSVQRGPEAYPCAASKRVMNTSPWKRWLISRGSADSRKSLTASFRLAVASSTVAPWLATSSSGHRATYRSPSFPKIAV